MEISVNINLKPSIVKKELIFNTDLHFEHEYWSRELNFWEDELDSFQNRLDELVIRWTDNDVLAQIEKFQNKLLIQYEVINSIKNRIEMHEANMASHSMKNQDSLNKDLVKKHLVIRERMEEQRDQMSLLKKDLFKFLTKYM